MSSQEVDVAENKMRWNLEEASYIQSIMFGKTPLNHPMHLSSPTDSADDSLPINASFEIPELIVELFLPENTSSRVEKLEFLRALFRMLQDIGKYEHSGRITSALPEHVEHDVEA